MQGMFITFEGNDGSGKTTVSKEVYNLLLKEGYDVIYTREPGGIGISEEIRDIILDPKNITMDAKTEALLYAASRRQHLVEKILPALQANQIVLCDRFVASSLAYQGYARGIGIQEVYELNLFAIENHWPDATIFLQVPLEVGLKRVSKRGGLDRLDKESEDFHKQVAKGYEIVLSEYHKDALLIDANQELHQVILDTYHAVKGFIDEN